MRKSIFLSSLPFLCLASCGESNSSLSSGYKPNPELAYALRSGESLVNGESGFANLRIEEDPAKQIQVASATGETLIFYFYSLTCHYCVEVEEGFADFLEKTNLKVLAYTNLTSPNYHDAVNTLKTFSKENAEAFFKDWGTPWMFAYKDGEFSRIPLYGNHASARTVAKMMDQLYSFPYLYELASFQGIDSFLKKGYPVYLLNEGEELPHILKSSIQTNTKPIGYAPKALLSEEDLAKINDQHGESSCLLTSAGDLKKEDCSSYLKSYFAG